MKKSLEIGIIGYGNMGRMVETAALEAGHKISFIAESEDSPWGDADVLIEFSRPSSARKNFNKALELKIPIVTGTTGWHDAVKEVEDEVERQQGSLLYASNFSVGVNILFALNAHLAKLMSGNQSYKTDIQEIHHTQKKDSPSGTAISLAQGIIEGHPSYDRWKNSSAFQGDEIPIESIREPEVPGTHIIKWENEIDKIELSHEAKNRKGFAQGAILAAEWIIGKKGIFTMKDVLQID